MHSAENPHATFLLILGLFLVGYGCILAAARIVLLALVVRRLKRELRVHFLDVNSEAGVPRLLAEDATSEVMPRNTTRLLSRLVALRQAVGPILLVFIGLAGGFKFAVATQTAKPGSSWEITAAFVEATLAPLPFIPSGWLGPLPEHPPLPPTPSLFAATPSFDIELPSSVTISRPIDGTTVYPDEFALVDGRVPPNTRLPVFVLYREPGDSVWWALRASVHRDGSWGLFVARDEARRYTWGGPPGTLELTAVIGTPLGDGPLTSSASDRFRVSDSMVATLGLKKSAAIRVHIAAPVQNRR